MRTLIVGSGFVGRAVADRLARAGERPVLASRRPPPHAAAPWTPLDVTDPASCARALDDTAAEQVVLVHGPSDVTWCDRHPAEAMAGHETAARNMLAAAGDRRLVLISTDNVFDGSRPDCAEATPTAPPNAYGRAKLAAEQVFAGHAAATVLRVSLVYGWEPADSAKWLNFFAACAHRLLAGEPVAVPHDQWTTPVLVDDVAAVTAAVLTARDVPLLHLGGPDRISRADWALLIAAELGVAPGLVVAEPRAAGRYAGRPENTCLTSTLLSRLPATAGVPVRGVREAARLLVADGVRAAR
ncbi:sugar nucleotide-binding protein [Micromonospora harpali]|uniref:SDR family oxidoreductase n=1 Tax=Micromonospora harpali TaxID=1490225 RepID=A0ABW1HIC0_9ACTN